MAALIVAAIAVGLTLAPEVARDDMREQIRKKIKNEDLYEGCREAFRHGWQQVKLYFMCGLPGERAVDLGRHRRHGRDDLADRQGRAGHDYAKVTASVSNFVPKPHTPYQWNGMQTREYFRMGADYLLTKPPHPEPSKSSAIRSRLSLVEGVLSRGDRRMGAAILDWPGARGAAG